VLAQRLRPELFPGGLIVGWPMPQLAHTID
jgi:hypothetical protein